MVKPNGYISVDVGYATTSFNNVSNSSANPNPKPSIFNNVLFHSVNASTTIFKPLNDKHFFLKCRIRSKWKYSKFKKRRRTKFICFGIINVWHKKSYNGMWAFGISRSYRLGRVIHVPAILWSKNFNKK